MPYGTPFSAILRRFAQDPRKSWSTGHRPAATSATRPATRNPRPATPQLGRVGPEGRHRPRGPGGGLRPEPVPYGTPFSAILRRSTQDPRKSWPTGHRPAATSATRLATRNPRPVTPQLRCLGRNSRRRLRVADLAGALYLNPRRNGASFKASFEASCSRRKSGALLTGLRTSC